MKYKYLKSRDVMQAGDEYHQFGKIWFEIGPHRVGHRKGDAFSNATRVRRPPGPVADGPRQMETFS